MVVWTTMVTLLFPTQGRAWTLWHTLNVGCSLPSSSCSMSPVKTGTMPIRACRMALRDFIRRHRHHHRREYSQNRTSTSSLPRLTKVPSISRSLLMSCTVITTPSTSYCLSLLTSNNSVPSPPPILFLISLFPQSLSPPASPRIANAVPSETSSRSSASHKKHPQSDSSERILAYGPEFLQLVSSQGHFGLAHVLCVALCQQGDLWNLESLTRLGDWGVGNILSVPCEPSNVSGLYMVLIVLNHLFTDCLASAETDIAFLRRFDCHCTVSENECCSTI